MDTTLQETCDLIIDNYHKIKKCMFWEIAANNVAVMSSFLSASNGAVSSAEKYRECKKILKKNASIFSSFRGISESMVVTKMTLADNPREYLSGAIEVYKKLRQLHKLTASPYMVLAAMTIYENGGLSKADENIEQLEKLYKSLKKKHPMLTWDSDRGYLSMIVASGLNIDTVEEEIERCYEACKSITIVRDSVHSLAQVLALSPKATEEKANEVKEIIQLLKQRKKRVSKSYTLSSLGALTLLDMDASQKADLIVEVDDYLKTQKGFKWYSIDPYIRRVYAILIVLLAYSSSEQSKVSENISGTLTMVIVEQIITLIIIYAVSSSSAASGSSSN